ncbi:c-type cytochrome [Salinimicrobium flavum]|uniref:C-type cytochrome n=1 Tax=Salinimicrobium flavum TaxID=1737065 RepID=A0ABW5ITX3_9FLAO
MQNKLILIFSLFLFAGCKNASEGENSLDHISAEKSPELKESISRGAGIYNNFCASCHLAGGEGIAGVFPPLKDSDWLTEKREASIHAVKYGLKGPIKVNGEKYDNLMPALGLENGEIADVFNYINNSWGNNVEKPVTKEEVAAIEK